MHRGYTKRWRKRWDKGYHTDALSWVMMDYFIDFATYIDKEFPFIWKGAIVEMIKLKRGQCFFTFEGLATFLTGPKFKVSRKMIRRRTEILSKIGFLEHQSGTHYQIISVCNYDKYNPLEATEGHQSEHQWNINGTSMEHQRDTTKNIKNIKKEKKDKNTNGAHGWPENFSLDEKKTQYAVENGIDKDKVKPFFEDFHDWALSKAAKYTDWEAAFRTRVRKAEAYGRQFLRDEKYNQKTEGQKWLERV